jgi:hypothetical protein
MKCGNPAMDEEAVKEDDGWGTNLPDQFNSSGNDENNHGTQSSGEANTDIWAPPQKEGGVHNRYTIQETFSVQQSARASGASSRKPHRRPTSRMPTKPCFGLWNESAQMKSNEQPAVIREINADKSAVIELGDKSTHSLALDNCRW